MKTSEISNNFAENKRPKLIRRILTLLLVLLITLKLVGAIDWPWWIVTIPFWGLALFGFCTLIRIRFDNQKG